MTIVDAETSTPVHCANTPGDDWLKHEGGTAGHGGWPLGGCGNNPLDKASGTGV